MPRRPAKKNEDPKLLTEADLLLDAHAKFSYGPYSRLKLSLTRFAWGGKGVEARARKKILAWASELIDVCVANAQKLDISAERYLRNLLPLLPVWLAPLLISSLRHDRALRHKLPGLKLSWMAVEIEDHRAELFQSLLTRHPQPRAPHELLRFIRLSDGAIDRAWVRWIKRNPGPEARNLLLNSSSGWRDRTTRISAILLAADCPEKTWNPAPTQPMSGDAQPKSLSGTDLPQIFWLSRKNGSNKNRINERMLIGVPKELHNIWLRLLDALQTDNQDQSSLHAFVELASAKPKLAHSVDRQLRAVLADTDLAGWSSNRAVHWTPPASKVVSIQWLTLLITNDQEAIQYLNGLTKPRLQSLFTAMGPTTFQLMAEAFCIAPRHETTEQIEPHLAALLLPPLIRDLGASVIPRLLLLHNPLKKEIRGLLFDRIRSFSAVEFAAFANATQQLDGQWKKLPLTFREEILDLWLRLKPSNVDAVSPSLLFDAARWGDDHVALAHLFLGSDPQRAVPLLKKWAAAEDQTAWQALLKQLRAAGTLPPASLRALSKEKRLLGTLLRDALPCFKETNLRDLDLITLFPLAMKHSWIARSIEASFSSEELLRVRGALKRTLRAHPRQWAASEIALAIGPRYAMGLSYLSNQPFPEVNGARFDGLYHSWSLPKRKGGNRLITAPKPFLKAIQRALLRTLFSDLPLHPAATGFREGLSIADNARPHVGKKVVLNVDITGFFANTRFPLIARAIESVLPPSMSPEARRLVTDICCYNGVLPTGAPTSPAIANLVLLRADRAIATVAARGEITYTRYADDLTFSGEEPLKILPFVRDVLAGLGYQLDHKKTNIFRKGRRQVVTGLVVNDKVSVPRLMRRKLRAAVHRASEQSGELTWHKVPMSRAELEGRIAFTAITHHDEAVKLFAKLRRAPGGKDGR